MTDQACRARIDRDTGQTTPTALRLRQGIAFEAWLGVGRRIADVSNASTWWLGDWLVYGQSAYGQRYHIAFEATSLEYQTLRNYAWVARRFAVSRRRDKLSFQHHAEVAALSEPEQDLWLQRAERLRWSRAELRRHLMAERRSHDSLETDAIVSHRVDVTASHEQRWRRAAEIADRSLDEWIVASIDAAADAILLEPPRRLAESRVRGVQARALGPSFRAGTRSAEAHSPTAPGRAVATTGS